MNKETTVLIELLKIVKKYIKSTVADNASSYSNLLEWKVSKSFDMKGKDFVAYIVLLYLTGGPNQTFLVRERRRLNRIATFRQDQGVFSLLKSLTLIEKPIPGLAVKVLLENLSTQSIFGNLVRDIGRVAKMIRAYNPYLSNRSLVVYPQRKRGYNDKGTAAPVDALYLEDLKGVREPLVFEDPPEWPLTYCNIGIYEKNDKTHAELVERDTSTPFERRKK